MSKALEMSRMLEKNSGESHVLDLYKDRVHIAAELRRLHELNAELVAALVEALSILSCRVAASLATEEYNEARIELRNAILLLRDAIEALAQQEKPHPSCKSDTLVNGGALILALNSLKRGTQSQIEIAKELEMTVQHLEKPTPVDGVVIREGSPTLLRNKDIKPTDERLYTQLPRREWVGLTDSQKTQLYFESDKLLLSKAECEIYMDGVNDAEAKLKELNT